MQLPWRLVTVPADGRCSLHAVAVACGYVQADAVVRELLVFYQKTQAVTLIKTLYQDGNFYEDQNLTGFGSAHVANPLEFREFIMYKAPWITRVVACECDAMPRMNRMTVTHADVISLVHRTNAKHKPTTTAVAAREAVVFLNISSHWHVLLPFEKSIGLPGTSAPVAEHGRTPPLALIHQTQFRAKGV